jgi:hypothetical protein
VPVPRCLPGAHVPSACPARSAVLVPGAWQFEPCACPGSMPQAALQFEACPEVSGVGRSLWPVQCPVSRPVPAHLQPESAWPVPGFKVVSRRVPGPGPRRVQAQGSSALWFSAAPFWCSVSEVILVLSSVHQHPEARSPVGSGTGSVLVFIHSFARPVFEFQSQFLQSNCVI